MWYYQFVPVKCLQWRVITDMIIFDVTHVPVPHYSDGCAKSIYHIDKNKRRVINLIITNTKGTMAIKGKSSADSTHIIIMFRDDEFDFDDILGKMHDPNTSEEKKVTVYTDRDYQDIANDILGANVTLFLKCYKYSLVTAKEKK